MNENTIPAMADLADNDLQRMALTRLKARTVALREGMAKLTEQLTIRTELLRNTIDASQAEAIGVIDELSVKMRQREQRAQETFDHTLSAIFGRNLMSPKARSERLSHICDVILGYVLRD